MGETSAVWILTTESIGLGCPATVVQIIYRCRKMTVYNTVREDTAVTCSSRGTCGIFRLLIAIARISEDIKVTELHLLANLCKLV